MLLSMTGFSSKTVTLALDKNKKVLLSIELKSVNSRFFEVVCKLPSILNSLETKITQILKSKLLRGRVYFNIKFEEENISLEKISPNYELLEGYLKALQEIKQRYKISGDITIADILSLQGLFVSKKVEITTKSEQELLKIVEEVANLLVKNRLAEGKNLLKDLEKSFLTCTKKSDQIKNCFDKQIKEIKGKIKELLVLQQENKEDVKLKLDELYSTLNKIDINEEIIRFKSHLQRLKKVLKDTDKEKGKRIDFLLQELLRESNTMLAKSSSCVISGAAVDIKVELEKAREQIQNIV